MSKDGVSISSGNESLDIRVDDDEMVITGVDGDGQQFQQRVSTEQKLPDAFPKDMPIPSDVELTVIESDMDGKMQYIVQYTVEGTVKEYYELYRNYIDQADYETIIDASDGKASEDSGIENMMAKSDEQSLHVSIMKSGTGEFDRGLVVVNLMYMKE